mmetsp:Transcript_25401/g.73105  ORF Transcript_25401/g.73105 Transcript_25401/m.73105 type:complete len:255 (+) Transcript_25401:581-1345(+)
MGRLGRLERPGRGSTPQLHPERRSPLHETRWRIAGPHAGAAQRAAVGAGGGRGDSHALGLPDRSEVGERAAGAQHDESGGRGGGWRGYGRRRGSRGRLRLGRAAPDSGGLQGRGGSPRGAREEDAHVHAGVVSCLGHYRSLPRLVRHRGARRCGDQGHVPRPRARRRHGEREARQLQGCDRALGGRGVAPPTVDGPRLCHLQPLRLGSVVEGRRRGLAIDRRLLLLQVRGHRDECARRDVSVRRDRRGKPERPR